jgi:hypothetical protein
MPGKSRTMAFFKGIFVNLSETPSKPTKVASQPDKKPEKKMGLFAPLPVPRIGIHVPVSNAAAITPTGERRVDQLKSDFLS